MNSDTFDKSLKGDRTAQLMAMVETLAVHMSTLTFFLRDPEFKDLMNKTLELSASALECLKAAREEPAKEPPLLLCVSCKNTESPAGAMARQFNHGRCMHCGGSFMVLRA